VPTGFATIPAGGFVVTIGSSQTLGGVSVATGDTLTCSGSCTLTTNNAAQGVFNSGTINNYGTIKYTVPTPASGGFFNSGTVNNQGTITITLGSGTSGGFFNNGVFTNSGTGILTVKIGGSSSGGLYNTGGTFFNHGTVAITGADLTFDNTGGTFQNICGGTVSESPTSGNAIQTIACAPPVIYYVSPVNRASSTYIIIYGKWFNPDVIGPAREPANHAFSGVDTIYNVCAPTCPSLGIADLNQGWNAGGDYGASKVTVDGYTFSGYNDIGVLGLSWSDSTITLTGFGNALPNYPHGYHIHNGDKLLIVIFTRIGTTFAVTKYTGPSF
jgi:hypothetical protein